MPATIKKFLIAAFILIPAFSTAAETAAVGEQKPAPIVTPVAPPPQSAPLQPPAAVPAVQTTRIGYVDMAKIFGESDRGKVLKALFITKKDQLQKKIDEKKKQLEKLKSSIEAKIATMAPAQREAKAGRT